jgi:hypothetical protein
MAKYRKLIPVSVIAFSLILTGVAVGQQDLAKEEKLQKVEKLKQQEQAEMAKLQAMKGSTKEEIEKQMEQERKVKQLGIEVGNLQDELHPEVTRDHVDEVIRTLKDIFNANKDYADKANDPVNGAKYKKANEILQHKIKILEQIEKDFNLNNKSLEQIQKELDDLKAIRELE